MITSWSFSTLMLYEKCPWAAKLKLVDRCPEPPPEPDSAGVRGNKFHKSIEKFLKHDNPLIPELEPWTDYLNDLPHYSSEPFHIEEDWGFDEWWKPVSWRDATCRMKLDLGIKEGSIFRVYDWKTGKAAGNEIKHTMQGQLYAVGVLAKFSDVQAVNVKFEYLDFPDSKPLSATYTPSQIIRFRDSYNRRAERMMTDTTFRPIPNKSNCRYCPMKQNCQYGVE